MRDDAPAHTAVLVAVGGAAGASLRYAVGLAVGGLAGTLAANVVGSVALGALVAAGDRVPTRARIALGGGLLSSFTTYSTFAVETLTVPLPVAAGYVLASVVLGLGAALLADALVEPGLGGFVRPPDDADEGSADPDGPADGAGGDGS